MSPEDDQTKANRALVRRAFKSISGRKYDEVTSLLTAELQEGAKESGAAAAQAFPDLDLELEDLIAEGDKVVARWTARGTHKGNGRHGKLGDVKGTGKSIEVQGITIIRIENGKVAETWGVTDEAAGMQQLGLIGKKPS